jgi:SAM-dependent methyltransferase
VRRAVVSLESTLVTVERERNIIAPWAVASGRFTAGDNRGWWNTHDWSRLGEEWTPSEEWKRAVVARFLVPYLPEAAPLLEIGPGAGRWTAVLQSRASVLHVVDLAEVALSACRRRFAGCANVNYILGTGSTIALPDAAVEGIWSYDVFVHVNPADTLRYFREFRRVLRPGCCAVVHHPGAAGPAERARHHRSDLTDGMVARAARESDLEVVLQCRELVNVGDTVTVLRRPAG